MDNRITKGDVIEQEDWIVVQRRPSPTEKDKRMRPAEKNYRMYKSPPQAERKFNSSTKAG